jgi:hypothetical protein
MSDENVNKLTDDDIELRHHLSKDILNDAIAMADRYFEKLKTITNNKAVLSISISFTVDDKCSTYTSFDFTNQDGNGVQHSCLGVDFATKQPE